MECPVCDVNLSISSREGVEIDFCPQCRGVWLDRGELDKIIDRVNQGAAPAPPSPEPSRRAEPRHEERADYDRRYDKRRKRRSLLEELFDFD